MDARVMNLRAIVINFRKIGPCEFTKIVQLMYIHKSKSSLRISCQTLALESLCPST